MPGRFSVPRRGDLFDGDFPHDVPLLDLLDHVETGLVRHLSEDGVFAVEEGLRTEADVELAVGAVRIIRAGHGDGAEEMRFLVEFGLEVDPEPPVPFPLGSPP